MTTPTTPAPKGPAMPQSLTRLLFHLVFSTKHREPIIQDVWRPDLHSYIGGIVRNRRGDLIAAGGIEDHIHLLVRIPPTICPADLIRDVKSNSTLWRRNQGDAGFGWQNGYGAFTVSPTMTETVIEYINTQREHHRTVTFREEYLAFMKRYGVEYDERYVWD
ncbi:MAG: IS200/IS605 family transposase [Fimbriiglobus sp.]|nr:IS200/IS605 family transposase [Fimbriiglobus sp.]